jgi:signal transduction histidine kinase
LYTLGKVNDDNQLLINVVSHDVRNYLSNLVGNAIKFSARGGTVALGLREQAGKKILTITNQASASDCGGFPRGREWG